MKRVPLAFAVAITVTGALFSQGAAATEQGSLVSADGLESGILTRVNALRTRRGLSPLRLSRDLSAAAHSHVRQMARRGFCDHDSADGSSFWQRLSRYYQRSRGWRMWAAGENILCNPGRLSAAGAVSQWYNSAGHRANLLSTQWRDVGLAAVYVENAPGEFRGQDVVLVTADFGVRRQ